jgi:hypothetical protein
MLALHDAALVCNLFIIEENGANCIPEAAGRTAQGYTSLS